MNVRFMVPLKNGIDAVKNITCFRSGCGRLRSSVVAVRRDSAHSSCGCFSSSEKITTLKKQQKMPSRPTALKKMSSEGVSLTDAVDWEWKETGAGAARLIKPPERQTEFCCSLAASSSVAASKPPSIWATTQKKKTSLAAWDASAPPQQRNGTSANSVFFRVLEKRIESSSSDSSCFFFFFTCSRGDQKHLQSLAPLLFLKLTTSQLQTPWIGGLIGCMYLIILLITLQTP